MYFRSGLFCDTNLFLKMYIFLFLTIPGIQKTVDIGEFPSKAFFVSPALTPEKPVQKSSTQPEVLLIDTPKACENEVETKIDSNTSKPNDINQHSEQND